MTPSWQGFLDFHEAQGRPGETAGASDQAAAPGFPHTPLSQVLFFCLNRRQRAAGCLAEPSWSPSPTSHSEQLSETRGSRGQPLTFGRGSPRTCSPEGLWLAGLLLKTEAVSFLGLSGLSLHETKPHTGAE